MFYPSLTQHQSPFRKLLPLFVGLKSALLSHTAEEIFWQTVILNGGFLDEKFSIANYWWSLRISWIINAVVVVICRGLRLRQITQSRGLILLDIMRRPNSIIVLIIHFLKRRHSAKEDTLLEFAKVWEQRYTSEGLGNLAAFELDIRSRYWVIIMDYHVNFTHHCILTECSRLNRVFIVSLVYNNGVCL